MPSDSHTPNSMMFDENPEALAKHAIAVLEQRLYSDFGIKVRLGAELEFTLLPRHDKALGIKQISPIKFGVKRDDIHKSGFTPAVHRAKQQSARVASDKASPTKLITEITDPFFPDSPYVAYSYEELFRNKYESVISHEARHDTLPPDGSRALTFARSIEALRNTIATSNQPARRLAKDPAHHELLAPIARDWQPAFDGYLQPVDDDDRCHGLHINLSLVNSDDKPLLYHMGGSMAARMQMIFGDGNHMLLPDDASISREVERDPENNTNQCVYERAKQSYLEIRRPAANSNPYYATMLSLLGVYHYMAKLPAPSRLAIDKPTHDAFAKRFFSPDNMVINTLNQLEPELGSRMRNAIECHPPGTEARLDKGHSR